MKLECSKCCRLTCISCFKMILAKININDYDNWCNEVSKYIKNGIIPKHFIGHCCEVAHRKKILCTSLGQKKKFDGWVFFPELMLLIDSPLNGDIDIHGFGKGDSNISPLIHGVIGHDLARYLYQVRFKPSHKSKQFISSHVQLIKYNNYLGHSETIKIMIMKYKMIDTPFKSLFHSDVLYAHIKNSFICPIIGNEIDVSIIISMKENENLPACTSEIP